MILDDHTPRRLRSGYDGETTLYHPASTYGPNSTEGFVRALIRSDNGAAHARLLEVTVTAEGVTYHVVAERAGYELDEFVVSDDLSTVALLWNIDGRSELQVLGMPTRRCRRRFRCPVRSPVSSASAPAGRWLR